MSLWPLDTVLFMHGVAVESRSPQDHYPCVVYLIPQSTRYFVKKDHNRNNTTFYDDMDVLRCSLLSAVETALLGKSVKVTHEFLSRMLMLLAIQYIALKLFYILIWPFYFSPLRHLPTAKVRLMI